ncbi:MAG: hypothetical protein PHC43_07515 [Candidatus Marinimicrobia bacterium]|nr:hypothetical protein [Candidatus Neomarinimicrobiota bacterium]
MKRYICIHRPAEDGFECQHRFNPFSYDCWHCYYRQEWKWYDNLFWPAILTILVGGSIGIAVAIIKWLIGVL